ncbi:Depudecin biosynthesis cluster-specific transcription activator [Lachnellula suecica]|uniref:Depudecin biosynthesis cluster-specific transcription activator n=1 Tax=Lachnellula suecica TaxID=602035 RepID=A0A8T9CN90_9HELO|nr:Depudecin biosynthesis cluster-specific transcription activator [Lachnellula suecica]
MSVPVTGWFNMDADSHNSDSIAHATTASTITIAANNAISSSSNTEPQARNDGQEGNRDDAVSTTAKRLACDGCRERKVRCDKQHPKCRRCARLGHNCKYSGPSKQTMLKNDLSRMLMTLHGRLAQAEAQLALGSPMLNMQQYNMLWPETGLASGMNSTEIVSAQQFSPTDQLQTQDFGNVNMLDGIDNPGKVDDLMMPMESNNDWSDKAQCMTQVSLLIVTFFRLNQKQGDVNFHFNNLESTLPSDFSHSMPDAGQIFDPNPASHEPSLSSHSDYSSQAASKISAGVFSQL